MSPARVLRAVWQWLKGLAARRGRRVLWYAPFFTGAAGQVWNAGHQTAQGDHWHAATAGVFAAMLILWPIAARNQFREAWADGYVEGVFTHVETRRHTVPTPLLRATTTGHLSPEPWDPPPPWEARLQRHQDSEGAQ